MKKIFLFSILFVPFLGWAQYSFRDLSGKWVEQTRTDKHQEVIPFKDTLYIEIREDGFMMVRHTIGATTLGDATLIDNEISVEKEKFMIETVGKDILKLKQDKRTHRFIKQQEFQDAPVTKVIPGIETGNGSIELNQLNGKWNCYKKTDPSFNNTKFYIKQLEIYDQLLHSMNVDVTFQNMDTAYKAEMKIQLNQRKMILQGEGIYKALTIVKADNEEMILQDGSVHYFLKRVVKK